MPLKDTIENEYKTALKSKDKNKISTYRLILSSIKDLDIVNRSGPNKKDTDDEDIMMSSSSVSFLLGPDRLTMSRSLMDDNINL